MKLPTEDIIAKLFFVTFSLFAITWLSVGIITFVPKIFKSDHVHVTCDDRVLSDEEAALDKDPTVLWTEQHFNDRYQACVREYRRIRNNQGDRQ